MSTSIENLIEALRARGLVRDDAAHFEPPPPDRPWYINFVLGFAGWLAGIFALLFVAMLFRPDSAAGYGTAGVVLLAAAFGLYSVDRESAFFDQLALALSIAGQFAIMAAAWELTESAIGTAAIVALMQTTLLLIMPNRLARAIAAFFACIAWALTIRFALWGEWSRANPRDIALAPALVGWFVIWTPIALLVHRMIATEARWMAQDIRAAIRPGLSGLLVALSLGTWCSEPLGSLSFWDPTGERQNWLALWPLLAIAAAMFATLSAYRLRNRALVGVGITGALLHVVQFYMVLGTSLLIKSSIMIAIGVLLLALTRANRHGTVTGASS